MTTTERPIRVQWNTGNCYSKHGQRIVAEAQNGVVLFNDIDRHISGRIKGEYTVNTKEDLIKVVKYLYVQGTDGYEYDTKASNLMWINIKEKAKQYWNLDLHVADLGEHLDETAGEAGRYYQHDDYYQKILAALKAKKAELEKLGAELSKAEPDWQTLCPRPPYEW